MCTSPNYLVWLGEYYPESRKEKFHFQPHCNYEKIIKAGFSFIEVGCGKFLECKQQAASMWSDRIVFESMLHDHNYFITLTYDDLHVPLDGCVHQEHMQMFLHRLRKKFARDFNVKDIKYFYCAEYGGKTLRPHYHLILFNCPIPDLTDVFESKEADGRYHKHLRPQSLRNSSKWSKIIYDLWYYSGTIRKYLDKDKKKFIDIPYSTGGNIYVDELNYNTAAYVAGYVNKKVDDIHNKFIEKLGLTPEFHRQSNRPGIGAGMFEPEMFNKSCLIVPRSGDAKLTQPPRYFEKLLDRDYPWLFNDLREKRANKRSERLNAYLAGNEFKDDKNFARAAKNKSRQQLRDKI